MTRKSFVLGALFLVLVLATPAFAQPGGGEGPRGARGGRAGRGAVAISDANAQETQQRLQELLQQYPPSLRAVLALDPTLLTNPAYLEPYPQLAAFIEQHPDIAHNPTFYFQQQLDYLNRRNDNYNDPRNLAIREVGDILGGLALLIAALTMIGAVIWVIRTVIEHRKWLRVSKTHVETHAKIMDRLTSNEDLITYMESPAGRRFLEAAPIPLDGGRRMLNAPFGRILWSVQAGLVVASLGGGLIYASHRLASSDTYSLGEVPLLVVGIAALAVGAGFFVSAFFAYGLSQRLGLFTPPSSTPDSGSAHGA